MTGVPPMVHDVLRSSGQLLDTTTRSFFEPRFGQDFSAVRVHTDARAAESAQAVNALAYTVGHDVVFNAGQYAPQTKAGRKLMAHELTHVVQQSSESALNYATSMPFAISSPADRFEHTASQIADAVEMERRSWGRDAVFSNEQPPAYAILQRQEDGDGGATTMAGEEIRARCLPLGCPVSTVCNGEIMALTDCGTGTCPTCPPGFGNLIIRAWCTYTGVQSGKSAIILKTVFGGTIGPLCV